MAFKCSVNFNYLRITNWQSRRFRLVYSGAKRLFSEDGRLLKHAVCSAVSNKCGATMGAASKPLPQA